MFCMLRKKKIYPVQFSKHSANGEKQVTLLLVSNRKIPKAKFKRCKAKSEGRQAKSEGQQWQ